jgi:hypothetical protein
VACFAICRPSWGLLCMASHGRHRPNTMPQWRQNTAPGRANHRAVRSIPGVEARIFVPPVANHVPHLLIPYDPNRIKLSASEVMQKMRDGTPRIELPIHRWRPLERGTNGRPQCDCCGRLDAAAGRRSDCGEAASRGLRRRREMSTTQFRRMFWTTARAPAGGGKTL